MPANLTDAKIRNIPTPEKPKKLFDGDGLFLQLTPAGGRWWRFRYWFQKKEKLLSFGTYPAVSLKEAREKRDETRDLLAKGIDPGVDRKETKAKEAAERFTFTVAAERWFEHHAAGTVPRTQTKNRMYLAAINDIFKRKSIDDTALASLDRKTFVDVVQVIEKEKSSHFAFRAATVLKNVCVYAYNEGRLAAVHTYELGKVLNPHETKHRPALIDPVAVGSLLRKIQHYSGEGSSVSYCLRILPYIALRSEEIRGARWSELDLDAALWTVPATRHEHGGGMKMRIEHTVPLSRQVVSLFRELKEKQVALLGDCELCFPSPRAKSRQITSESLMCALKVIHGQSDISVHGFRTSFSTLAREKGFNPDHVEKQLAHQLKDRVEATYNKAEYLEQRRKMMQEWADYIDGLRAQVGHLVEPAANK